MSAESMYRAFKDETRKDREADERCLVEGRHVTAQAFRDLREGAEADRDRLAAEVAGERVANDVLAGNCDRLAAELDTERERADDMALQLLAATSRLGGAAARLAEAERIMRFWLDWPSVGPDRGRPRFGRDTMTDLSDALVCRCVLVPGPDDISKPRALWPRIPGADGCPVHEGYNEPDSAGTDTNSPSAE